MLLEGRKSTWICVCRFSELLHDMDLVELQHYLANLLSALAHIHSLGILHRFTHGLIISAGSGPPKYRVA
jgi:hypothetical protein